jgi:hypothetical protein
LRVVCVCDSHAYCGCRKRKKCLAHIVRGGCLWILFNMHFWEFFERLFFPTVVVFSLFAKHAFPLWIYYLRIFVGDTWLGFSIQTYNKSGSVFCLYFAEAE